MITLASIVEREAQLPEERPIIAGVFYNRLEKGMKLDADPTTQFALGHEGDWWPYLRLDPNTVDHRTTRTSTRPAARPDQQPGAGLDRGGDPPGAHDYLYFVACGKGGHAFAATLEEHERNRVRCGNR